MDSIGVMHKNGKFVAILTGLLLAASVSLTSRAEVTIERLTWAGVKMTTSATTVLIDPIGTDLWGGQAPEGLVPVDSGTGRTYALVTHTHNDHFDVPTLARVLGEKGYVICDEAVASYVASRGLKVIPAKLYHPVERGGFTITAVPAVDGFGGNQVSWVIAVEGKKYFHGGDTLWHGGFATIGNQHGPFDVTFLPINGARTRPDIPTPAVLTPEQAVDAAILLKAETVVPIHYGLDDPPFYVEVKDALKSFLETAKSRNVRAVHLKPGQLLQ